MTQRTLQTIAHEAHGSQESQEPAFARHSRNLTAASKMATHAVELLWGSSAGSARRKQPSIVQKL